MKKDFDEESVKIRTYVVFYDSGPRDIETEVTSRDPSKLDFNHGRASFQFHDRKTVMIDGEVFQTAPFNLSPCYVMAKRLLSLSDIHLENNTQAVFVTYGLKPGEYMAETSDGTYLRADPRVIYIDKTGNPLPLPEGTTTPQAKPSR